MTQCDNNIINNKIIGFLDNICSNISYSIINKHKNTYIVPQYLSLDIYNTKDISNMCTLCAICWKNRYDNIRRLYPNNRLTDRIKLEFLSKVKPQLVIDNTIYRQLIIDNINRHRYTNEEINRGCSTMDIDNDPLIL